MELTLTSALNKTKKKKLYVVSLFPCLIQLNLAQNGHIPLSALIGNPSLFEKGLISALLSE